MIRFENEFILYFLALIPLIIGIYVWRCYAQKKKLSKYADTSLVGTLMPDRSLGLQHVKFLLSCLVLVFLLLAAVNPQVGASTEKSQRKGINILFCVDVSNSMLAQDYNPNRLEATKLNLLSFIDRLDGDKIGVVIFAGKAFVQLPLTSDYAAAKMFINAISTTQIATQGTDVATAIDVAAASMLPTDKNEELTAANKAAKVIVVISDGEDHFDEAAQMASSVAEQGIMVFTLGVGSTNGAPIADKRGNYKKDKEGNTIITRLNAKTLNDIAKSGKGSYIYANNANMGFDKLFDELDKIEKSDLEQITFTKYKSRFYIPLTIAMILLLIELFILPKRRLKLNFLEKIGGQSKTLVFLLLLSSGYHLMAQTKDDKNAIRTGNKQYEQAQKLEKEAKEIAAKNRQSDKNTIFEKQQKAQELYQSANTNYIKGATKTGDYYKSVYNQGNSLYKQKKYSDALEKFSNVANNNQIPDKVRSQSYYNMGNSLFEQEKYEESIQAYKESLKLNAKDTDAKYNLEVARRKMIQQQQQQQQQQQNQKKKDNQDKQGNQNKQDQQKGENQNDKNKEQGNKDQKGDHKDQKDKQNSGDNQDEGQDQKGENQNSEAAKQKREQAKRQLDALQQNERKTQEKVQIKEVQKARNAKQEKDW